MRKIQFTEGQFYHIYNRGTEKRKIFLDDFDYRRFLESMREFNNVEPIGSLYEKYLRERKNGGLVSTVGAETPKSSKPLVEFVCYSLLPNHFHFILEQVAEKGIEKFMQRLGTGYTMHFNKKYQRTGALFQGTFKASEIKPNNFFYLSVYVNCNAEVHGIARAEVYRWSSFPEYIDKRKKGLCENGKKIILDNFRSAEDYKEYAKGNVKHFQERKLDEKELLSLEEFS